MKLRQKNRALGSELPYILIELLITPYHTKVPHIVTKFAQISKQISKPQCTNKTEKHRNCYSEKTLSAKSPKMIAEVQSMITCL